MAVRIIVCDGWSGKKEYQRSEEVYEQDRVGHKVSAEKTAQWQEEGWRPDGGGKWVKGKRWKTKMIIVE